MRILPKGVRGGFDERYIEKLIDVETRNTVRFINRLNAAGLKVRDVRADLSHMFSTAMFNGMFEVIAHDLKKAKPANTLKNCNISLTRGGIKF